MAREADVRDSLALAGLVMLMKVMTKELAPHSIRVNTVHPTAEYVTGTTQVIDAGGAL